MEFLAEKGGIVVVFIAVCIFAAVGFFLAAKSTASHNKSYKQREAEIKELTMLKEKYIGFTAESLKNCPDEEILKGVCVLYQREISKSENAEEVFNAFSEEIQRLYVLDIFVEDGSFSEFYQKSDDLLRKRLLPAFEMIGMPELSEKFDKIDKMHDKNDETVSYNKAEIEKADKYISDNNVLSEIKLYSAEYIKDNADILKI